MCSLCEGKTDSGDLLTLARTERDTWRTEYHKQRAEAVNARTLTLHDAWHDQEKILFEFSSRYRDTASQELLAELRQRLHEAIELLIPVPEVRQSGK